MTLVRWEPSRELGTLQGDLNRFLSTFLDGLDRTAARRWSPAVDLTEADDHLVLKADLPGLSEDDVQIEVEDNVLTVSGERKAEREESRDGYHRMERSFGRFARSLRLPEGVDPDRIEASFDRGVLEVRIPKPEERRPHRVPIGAGGKTIEGTATEK